MLNSGLHHLSGLKSERKEPQRMSSPNAHFPGGETDAWRWRIASASQGKSAAEMREESF